MKPLRYYKNYLLQHKLKYLLQKWPELYRQIQLRRYRDQPNYSQIISPDSDILIEGYPRSANSFGTKAFKFANGTDTYKIATHLHVYSQVILGIRYKVPTMVMIRHPYDCVISYAAMVSDLTSYEQFVKSTDISWYLEDYIVFYKNLKPYEGQFLLASFKEVSTDYGKVMESLNDMYGVNFIPFEHTDENVQTVFSISDTHLSPSPHREAIKKKFVEEMDALKETKMYKEACDLYDYWVKSK